MLVQPFGFLAGAEEAVGFDPTLGGTITPFHWYDFTDSSTMTFSTGNQIEAISSKGSMTGDLAKGPWTKYGASWTAPTWEGSYTQFYGNNGTTARNSSLSRRYTSDGTDGQDDRPFEYNQPGTFIIFARVDFNPSPAPADNLYYLASIKNFNMNNLGYDEFNFFGVNTWTGITGTWTFSWLSTDTTKYPVVISHALRGSNQITAYSYNGVSPLDSGWVSLVTKQAAPTDGGEVQKKSTEVKDYGTDRPRSSSGNVSWENFTLGSRANYTAEGAYPFQIKHMLTYHAELTDAQIEDIRTEYINAYPSDNLNSVTN